MSVYLRPDAVLPLQKNTINDQTYQLGGVDWACFHSVELLEREGDVVTSKVQSADQVRNCYGKEIDLITAKRPDLLSLSFDRPRIMGILNVTPDSFSDGGLFESVPQAVEHALSMVEQGADVIDIGGESTRPKAPFIPVEQELERVIPVIEAVRSQTKALISIDTRKAAVMNEALEAGADMVNDVSALSFDENALDIIAAKQSPVILMHAQGVPQTMQDNPSYDHVVLDVYEYLKSRVEQAVKAGISRDNIIIDPGIGFGKTVAHNLALLNNLSLFHGMGVAVMLGCSRKSFIGAVSGGGDAKDRLGGSLAGVLKGALQGVQTYRVHDVKETRQALEVWLEEG